MSSLLNAMRTNDTHTQNGMVTNSTSLNANVDMFFKLAAMRGQNKNSIINVFTKAFYENPLIAMKLLFQLRDVRSGAGERQSFRDIINYMANNHKAVMGKNITNIPEFGRWDDVLSLIGTPLENSALDAVKSALLSDNAGLVAKWLPRPNVSNKGRKAQANVIRKFLGYSPKEYREVLVRLSNTLEQKMCANEWDSIEYGKLPSKAINDRSKVFKKHDESRFTSYLEKVEKGEATINAAAVYPYNVVQNLKNGDVQTANVQWKALPNYMEGNKERLLPMVDVSDSMKCPAGGNPNVTCMDVAVSLGMYISERNVGPFKDAFITFTDNPKLVVIGGTLKERYDQLRYNNVGYSTNVEKAFRLVLNKAIESNIHPDQMPTMILILSDMEFDASSLGLGAQDMIRKMYSDAGYTIPKICYWNIQAKSDNVPVHFEEEGTALVSGGSPSILKALLAGGQLTPVGMMMDVVNNPRYDCITI